MKIRLAAGDVNFCFLIRVVTRLKDERDSMLIQNDWDYPGVASTFGWTVGCECPTDGTVDCRHKTAAEHIASAHDYLIGHIGKVVEDPGYFQND